MVLRLAAKVAEDAVLPEELHVSPVLNLAVLNGVGNAVGVLHFVGLIADEEVEISDALLLLRSLRRASSNGALGNAESDLARNNEARVAVACVAHLGVAAMSACEDAQARERAACGRSYPVPLSMTTAGSPVRDMAAMRGEHEQD